MYSKTYNPSEIRNALDVYNRNKSFRKSSVLTGISKTTIHRWYHYFHFILIKRGRFQKRKRYRRQKIKYPNLELFLKQLFEDKELKYLTLQIIQNSFKCNKGPSLSWIRKTLKKLKISRRRFSITKIVSNNKERYKNQFDTFVGSIKTLRNEEIVCLDETGFCSLGNTVYRYFPRGQLPNKITTTKRESGSLIMAIHPISGIVNSSLQRKPFNSLSFIAYLEDLIPILPIGTKALLMDNVAFHKTKAARALMESNNLIPLFIPPYTPQCNPIEEVFSVLKGIFRSLDYSLPLEYRVNASMDNLKLYKGIVNNYNHTRKFVDNECRLQSEL